MITIKLFAVLREKAGTDEITLPVDQAMPIGDFLRRLAEERPDIGKLIESMQPRVAINHEFSKDDAIVRDGDEVALIPPVSGGSTGSSLVRIQLEDFSVDEAIAEVKKSSTAIGGIAVFLGTARDISKGKEVESLEFEHYPGMAEAKLNEIRERSLKDFDVLETLIYHRVGKITIAENIVLIVVGAEHREEAFVACKFCIDELKVITPIWKKEITPSGDSWVEPHP